MVVTAKLSQKPFIELPMEVYESFNLEEGDTVQIFITSTATKLTKKEKLARLEESRGIWADDENIKAAFEYLERKWAEWKPTELFSLTICSRN